MYSIYIIMLVYAKNDLLGAEKWRLETELKATKAALFSTQATVTQKTIDIQTRSATRLKMHK